MAGVKDGPVIIFCPLVQAIATGFTVSHLYPEATEKLQVTEEGPKAGGKIPRNSPALSPT